MIKKLIIFGVVLITLTIVIVVLASWRLVNMFDQVRAQRQAESQRIETHRNELTKNPHAFDKASAYWNDCGAGTGFLVQFSDKLLAVTAEHPFEGGKLPTNFFKLTSDAKANLGRKLLAENDVLVFEVSKREKDISPTLVYDPNFVLKNGDEIAVLSDLDFYHGRLQLVSDLTLPFTEQVTAQMDKPFEAMGCSGTAVIQVATGIVIGVLETADDPNQAKKIGFKVLDLRALK